MFFLVNYSMKKYCNPSEEYSLTSFFALKIEIQYNLFNCTPAFPACFNIGYLSVSLSCLSFLSANHAWLLSTCLVNSPSVLLSHACSAVHLACMPNVIPFLFTYPNFPRSFYIPIPFFCSACLLCLPLSYDLFIIHLFLCHLILAFPYLYCLWRQLLPYPLNF